MTHQRESRPEANGAASNRADAVANVTSDNLPVWVPCTWRPVAQDRLSQAKRRSRACARSIPLDCGCRDPWPCRCTEPPLTDCQLDGWATAARHLLAGGDMPLLPIEARRALWRRGGADRELAELLHDACGGVIA